MRKVYAFLFTLAIPFQWLLAQSNPTWAPVFAQINQEVQEHSQAYSQLKAATTQIGHRLTGSANGKRAEDFAFQLFKSWGFSQVNFQPFEVES